MKIFGDYHTHTLYSDGTVPVERNLIVAREKGLSAVAISDHGFNNPRGFSLRFPAALRQAEKVAELRPEYPELKVYHAIEADIIGLDGSVDMSLDEMRLFDFVIAGFHRFARPKDFHSFKHMYWNAYFSGVKAPSREEIDRNTRAYIKMVMNYPIAFVAHPNDYCKVDCYELGKCCADYGTYLELNAKHINVPREDFEKMLDTKVEFIANTDAHYPMRIARFELVEKYLEPYPEAWARIVNAKPGEVPFRKTK